MGSGLIWAGLGKGIADAGVTIGNSYMREAEEKSKFEREQRLEELREQRKIDREERDKKARIEESEKAYSMADALGASRKANGLNGLIASSISAGEQGDTTLSPEALRSIIKNDPALAKQYQDMGLIDPAMPLTRNQERLQRAEDVYSSAMKIGAHSSVLESLDKDRKRVLEEIKEENKEKREERKAANDERKTDELGRKTDALIEYLGKKGDAAETTAGAAVTRANRPAGGGSGGVRLRSTKTNSDGEVIGIMSDGSTVNLGIKSGEFEGRVASLITKMSRDDYNFSKLPEEEKRSRALARLNVTAAPAPEPAPAPAQTASQPGNNRGSRPPLSSFRAG